MTTIVAKAPGRVSLAGGGTDLPVYYERRGGAVVSFAIDIPSYAHITERGSDLELLSIDHGTRELISQATVLRRMRMPILAEEFLLYQKAVAAHFGIERGRIAAGSAVPAGAGLASSGSICVALVQAASTYVGEPMDRVRIAETASWIEMYLLRRACGKQDQFASAFGGLNLIEFFRDGSVDVTPVKTSPETTEALQRRIMLFHNGSRRSAVGPLQEQARRSASDPETLRALDRLKDIAYEVHEVIERGEIDRIGEILHEGWLAKQHLNSQVSTPEIVRVYALARRAGAVGGKLCGAGQGGTLLLYCHEDVQDEVRLTLASQGWRERRISIDRLGVTQELEVGTEHDLARQ